MLVDGRAISSTFVMAILLIWALFLLWCCRTGSWVMALFRNGPCIQHCDILWQKGPTLAKLCDVFVTCSAPEILWSSLKNQGN